MAEHNQPPTAPTKNRLWNRLVCIPPSDFDEKNPYAKMTEKEYYAHLEAGAATGPAMGPSMGPAMGPGDEEGENLVDQAAVLQEFSRMFSMFLFFMQQLGLIALENVDFGLWGDIFGWINVFSVNVDLDFNDDEGDVLAIVSAYLLPIFLMGLYHISFDVYGVVRNESRPVHLKKKIITKAKLGFRWRVMSVLSAITLVAGIVLALVEFAFIGALIGVLSVYILLYSLIGLYHLKKATAFVSRQVRKGVPLHMRGSAYFGPIGDIYILLITLLFTPLASLWARLALTNPNENIAYPAGIIGGLLVTYILIFLISVVNPSSLHKDLNCIGKLLKYLIFFGRKRDGMRLGFKSDTMTVLAVKVRNVNIGNLAFRDGLWWFEQVFLIERLLVVLAVNIIGEGSDEDIEIEDLTNAVVAIGIITCFTIAIYLVLPYVETKDNRVDLIPRFGNILLGVLAVTNSLVDPEDEGTRNTLAAFMLLDSFLLGIFWIYNLKPLRVLLALKHKKKEFDERMEGWKEAKRWKNVTTIEQAAAIILNTRGQAVSAVTWDLLYPAQRLLSLCVKRDHPNVELEAKTAINLVHDPYPQNAAKYGFAACGKMKDFRLCSSEVKASHMKTLSECEEFKMLRLEVLDLSTCPIGSDGCDYLLETIASAEFSLDRLYLNNCKFGKEKGLVIGDYLGTDDCRLSYLGLDNNAFGNEGAAPIFQGLTNNNRLRIISLNECDLDDGSVEIILQVMTENLVLKTIWLGRNNFTDDGATRIVEVANARGYSIYW